MVYNTWYLINRALNEWKNSQPQRKYLSPFWISIVFDFESKLQETEIDLHENFKNSVKWEEWGVNTQYYTGPVELGWQGWQLPPQYFDFFKVSTKKKFENQTKIGRLAAISNFCPILFISSKTVCFLDPNPKFNFMRSLQFFQRSQQKKYQTRLF